MLIPSMSFKDILWQSSLSRRVNANSQLFLPVDMAYYKLIKKGEC